MVESPRFSLGVRRIKATFMVAGVEVGKQVIREQITTRKFMPGKLSTLLEYTQAMHVEMKSFHGD